MRKNKSNKKYIFVVAVLFIVMLLMSPFIFIGSPADGLIKIRSGSSNETVGDSIKESIDVTFGSRVVTLLNLTGSDLTGRQGAFKVKKGDSPFKVMRMLRSGAECGIKFTFNNVRTKLEFAERFSSKFMIGKDLMDGALCSERLCAKYGKTPETIVCLLLPDSYEFYWDITPEELLDRFNDYYNKFWNDERKAKAKALGLTPDEVTIVASIVEEETAKNDERGKVARLYINRYQQSMPLQADPTVKYAIGDFTIKRLTIPMTRVESPYNTYRVQGLPPGPIRLPEKITIDAVLNAPQHNFLYMCAKEDFSGYHNFAVDYDTHMANARRYQAALNQRGIK